MLPARFHLDIFYVVAVVVFVVVVIIILGFLAVLSLNNISSYAVVLLSLLFMFIY